MNVLNLKFTTGLTPGAGTILISEPTLPDEHFHRSVVYLCSHTEDGSLGYVLNRKLQDPLSFFIEGLDESAMPLYVGGPVNLESIHFIHTKGKLLGGELVKDGVYHGGDFDYALSLIKDNKIGEEDVKFFLGYSGWDKQQLTEEINEKSWLVAPAKQSFLFDNSDKNLWKEAILNLDDEYHDLLKLPANPGMN